MVLDWLSSRASNVKGGRRISTTKKMRRRVGGETSLHVVDGVDTSIPFNTV